MHRRGLIVVKQIAGVERGLVAEELKTHLGKQIHGVLRMRQGRRQIACAELAGVAMDRLDRVFDHRLFLRLRQAVGVAGVVNAVAEKLPLALTTHLDDFGVVLAHGRRQRNRATDTVFVEQSHLPLVPDPVAVVADAVGRHTGVGAGPRLALRVIGWIEFVKLDVGGHPKSHLGPIGPTDGWAVFVGPVVVQTGVGFHAKSSKPFRLDAGADAASL